MATSVRYRSIRFAVSLVMALILVGTLASAALASDHLTGVRLNLLNPDNRPPDFPADTPFHLKHGWCLPGREGVGGGDVRVDIWVDGVKQRLSSFTEATAGCRVRWWFTNFPTGLAAGDHTFRIVWWTHRGEVAWEIDHTLKFVP
jgi:hypothetical protein